MSNGRSTDTSLHPEARSRWAAHVRDVWPLVRIAFVEASPRAAGCRVHAVVYLDGLAPADVEVSLAPRSVAGTAECSTARRMWSFESLDNGGVVFERMIPHAEEIAGDEWAICVRPAGGAAGRPVVYPLRLPHAREPGRESSERTADAPDAATGRPPQ